MYFPLVDKGVRNSSPTRARSGNEWLRYRDIALVRRCRVRHGGFVPAGETKLGDQWCIPMISPCVRVCRRAGFGASFASAGGPLLGNTVPIVDVPRVGQVQVAPRPPQPLRSPWAGGCASNIARALWANESESVRGNRNHLTQLLTTSSGLEDSFRKQKEDLLTIVAKTSDARSESNLGTS